MFERSRLAVNPAGPAPIIITSDCALSIRTECHSFAIARVISTSLTSVNIFVDFSAIVAFCTKIKIHRTN